MKIENAGVPNFTQVNINAEGKYGKFVQVLCYKFLEVVKEYMKILIWINLYSFKIIC